MPRLGPRIMLRSVDDEPVHLEARKDCVSNDNQDTCEKPASGNSMVLPITLGVVYVTLLHLRAYQSLTSRQNPHCYCCRRYLLSAPP